MTDSPSFKHHASMIQLTHRIIRIVPQTLFSAIVAFGW